jgi:small-conductance mechanosensitive channel
MMNILNELKSGAFADPATLPGAVAYALLFVFLAWLVGRILRLTVQRALAHDTHDLVDRTTVRFLAQLARMAVYVFAFITYAHLVPALARLSTIWLASVSIISAIIGLAAQNTLGNLIAGISLLLYRPFKVRDRLQITAPTGVETGVVENLNLGYTLLKTDDNRRVVVPNSIMASQTTISLTGDDPRAICSVPITITYDSDMDKARSVLLESAKKHPKIQQVRGCSVTQLGPYGIVLTLNAWCADAVIASEVKCDLLEQANKRFAVEGIKIPFLQTAIVLKNVLPPKF